MFLSSLDLEQPHALDDPRQVNPNRSRSEAFSTFPSQHVDYFSKSFKIFPLHFASLLFRALNGRIVLSKTIVPLKTFTAAILFVAFFISKWNYRFKTKPLITKESLIDFNKIHLQHLTLAAGCSPTQEMLVTNPNQGYFTAFCSSLLILGMFLLGEEFPQTPLLFPSENQFSR